MLYNAIFLDLVDQDALRMERMNRALTHLPEEEREGMRIIDLLVVRPSLDLGRIAAEYEPRLPGAFRFATRGLGTRETASPDLLSVIMFQDDYLKRLIEIGKPMRRRAPRRSARFWGARERLAGKWEQGIERMVASSPLH